MSDVDVRTLMIWIAIATPLLALAVVFVSRSSARRAGEEMPRSVMRNAAILAVAGPANLLLWFALNVWLERHGPGSVVGYLLAAVVFIAAGFATGLFARVFGKRNKD